jgi:hypothetical protein
MSSPTTPHDRESPHDVPQPRTREMILEDVEKIAQDAGAPPWVIRLAILVGELDRQWRDKYHELARVASSFAAQREEEQTERQATAKGQGERARDLGHDVTGGGLGLADRARPVLVAACLAGATLLVELSEIADALGVAGAAM